LTAGGKTLAWTQGYTYSDVKGALAAQVTDTIDTGQPGGPRSRTANLTLDAAGRVLQRDEIINGAPVSESFTYDGRGNVLTRTGPGGTTRYSYDGAGRLLSVTEPGEVTTSYTRDGQGRTLTQAGPHVGESWTFSYDTNGRLKSKVLAAYGSRPEASWTYDYSAGGGLVKETDPLGFVTESTYNGRGQLVSVLRKALDANGQQTAQQQTTYEWSGDWLTRTARTEGTWQTTLERSGLDDLGRPSHEVENWNGGGLQSRYTKDTSWSGYDGSVTETIQSGTDAENGAGATATRASTVTTDQAGRLLRRDQAGLTDAWQFDATGLLVQEDLAGKPTKTWTYEGDRLASIQYGQETTAYHYNPDGTLNNVTEPSQRQRTYEWNPTGQLQAVSYGGVRTSYEYDNGGMMKARTIGSARWEYGRGSQGELQSVTLPGSLGSIAYGYNANGQITGIAPSTGVPQTFDFDYLGRRSSQTLGTSRWSTTWQGWEGTTTDPNLEIKKTLLDGRGRVARMQYQPGPASSPNSDLSEIRLDYDWADQKLRAVETRSGGTTPTSFGYDGRGQITNVTRGADSVAYVPTASGQHGQVTSAAGSASYHFDALDRLDHIDGPSGTTYFEWEPGGQNLLSIHDDLLWERRCYDGDGRAISVTNAYSDPGCNALTIPVLSRFEYSYDDRGNRVTQMYSDSQIGVPQLTQYGFDLADRLAGVQNPDGSAILYGLMADASRKGEKNFAVGYAGSLADYDSTGLNPDQFQTYEFDGRGGLKGKWDELAQPQRSQIVSYVTDPAGRLVSEIRSGITKTYGWDIDGRLKNINVTGIGTTSFGYDALGLRRTRSGPDGTASYVWGDSELVEERFGSNQGLLYERLGHLVSRAGPERVMHDALSAVGRIGASTSPVAWRFDAWGNGIGGTLPTYGQPSIGFAGTHAEPALNAFYAQQRWGQPATGRWMSTDPMWRDFEHRVGTPQVSAEPPALTALGEVPLVPDGMGSPLLYAAGSPTKYADPTGLYFAAVNERLQPYLDMLRFGPSAIGQRIYQLIDSAPYPVSIGVASQTDVGNWATTYPDWGGNAYYRTSNSHGEWFNGANLEIDLDQILASKGQRSPDGTLVHELTHVLQAEKAKREDVWIRDWMSPEVKKQRSGWFVPAKSAERACNLNVLIYYRQIGRDPRAWLARLRLESRGAELLPPEWKDILPGEMRFFIPWED